MPESRSPSAEAAPSARTFDRRRFLAWAAAAGVGAGALPAALAQEAEAAGEITAEVLARAETVAGLEFTPEERELMLGGLEEQLEAYRALRQVHVDNSVPPALRFDPRLPGVDTPAGEPVPPPQPRPAARRGRFVSPAAAEALAFAPVSELARLLRERRVRSQDLTRMALDRLRRYDPALECVISLTEERALEAAAEADRVLDAGDAEGPLVGIPWGAKDLFAVAGHPTTWGAAPYREQEIAGDATVVQRLDAAGAVLVAKLTLGALAWGDVWFGGRTRNPWNLEQGSSGSSAGSAAATAAGLVGFALGTETWGSIVSPCTRTGCTGLRPTFGRVSRHGAMALSWSMDKVGPIARSAEDCALVFHAIQGPDGLDPTVVDAPFRWHPDVDPRRLRVGYAEALFEEEREDAEWAEHDRAVLAVLRDLGVELVPVALPDDLPVDSLSFILSAEAAAAFDELTRSGRDAELVRQVEQAWPNVLRQARTIPAVEYVQANRVRTLLMERWQRLTEGLDAYVVPSFGGSNLLATNLTGHPAVVLPNGFRDDGTPTSITFQGPLYGEGRLLALAHAYQQATDFHRRHPDLEAQIRRYEEAKAAQEAEEAEAAKAAGQGEAAGQKEVAGEGGQGSGSGG